MLPLGLYFSLVNTTTLSPHIQEFLDEKSTQTFLSVAQKFILLLESDNLSQAEFFRQSHKALIELYAAGHNLETIQLIDSNDIDFNDDELFDNKNKAQIGELQLQAFYWEVFNPSYFESVPQDDGWIMVNRQGDQGWLVDDYADIYRVLKIELTKKKLEPTRQLKMLYGS